MNRTRAKAVLASAKEDLKNGNKASAKRKVEQVKAATVSTAGGDVIIHFVDWNFQDKAYKFPSSKMKMLQQKLMAVPKGAAGKEIPEDIWDWFVQFAKPTRGIENADYFMDYNNSHESASEWEDLD